MTPPLLELRAVSVEVPIDGAYWPVVDDVSLVVERGRVIGLVGESGSGKSMTARSIVRLLPRGARSSGAVLFEGSDVTRFGRKALQRFRAHRSVMIFQDPRAHIDPLWTSGDYLTEGLRQIGHSRAKARQKALGLLADVGISDPDQVMRAYPSELSGGMLQRVMIAAALAPDPDLLIADEPTTAVDVTIQAEIAAILSDLRRDRQLGVLFITHDLELASALCDRVLVMYAGRVVESQPTRELFEAPLHPYTAGLLNARPQIEGDRARLAVIPGRPPSPNQLPAGCPFHPRCPFAKKVCMAARPPLVPLGNQRASACIRTAEIRGVLAAEGAAHVG
jgi:oligopeptide/dipeptide ABC transporter ATP-binding protein